MWQSHISCVDVHRLVAARDSAAQHRTAEGNRNSTIDQLIPDIFHLVDYFSHETPQSKILFFDSFKTFFFRSESPL